jgi:hypothetical protein
MASLFARGKTIFQRNLRRQSGVVGNSFFWPGWPEQAGIAFELL